MICIQLYLLVKYTVHIIEEKIVHFIQPTLPSDNILCLAQKLNCKNGVL